MMVRSNSKGKKILVAEMKMEIVQKWMRMLRMLKLSFKTATIVLSIINIFALFLLLQGFLSPSSKFSSHNPISDRIRRVRESEEMRRSMEPVELIKRLREIELESNTEQKTVQLIETKRTTAVDLSKRLKDFRSASEDANMKALDEWLKRKMERARQRELEKNGTAISQA